MNNDELELLEIQVKNFLDRCSEIKQKLEAQKNEIS